MKRFTIGGAVLLAALLGLTIVAAPARATVLRYVPFEEQVDSASVIVVAVTETSRSYWNASHSLIFTDVAFRVEQAVKGEPGASLRVTLPGGIVDRVGQEVDGSPQFASGARYVLFLEPTGDGGFRVLGFSQGSYNVAKGQDGKSKVTPQMAQAEHLHLLGGGSAAASGGQSLDEFLSRIRARLTRARIQSQDK
ncbi:hypothetical protein LLH00_12545 [bacterium]|nr:hypothetical protein [bacterium]